MASFETLILVIIVVAILALADDNSDEASDEEQSAEGRNGQMSGSVSTTVLRNKLNPRGDHRG
jgi:hypothetical protein